MVVREKVAPFFPIILVSTIAYCFVAIGIADTLAEYFADTSGAEPAAQMLKAIYNGYYTAVFTAILGALVSVTLLILIFMFCLDRVAKAKIDKTHKEYAKRTLKKYEADVEAAKKRLLADIQDLKHEKEELNASLDAKNQDFTDECERLIDQVELFLDKVDFDEARQIYQLIDDAGAFIYKVMTTAKRSEGDDAFRPKEQQKAEEIKRIMRPWCTDRLQELNAITKARKELRKILDL